VGFDKWPSCVLADSSRLVSIEFSPSPQGMLLDANIRHSSKPQDRLTYVRCLWLLMYSDTAVVMETDVFFPLPECFCYAAIKTEIDGIFRKASVGFGKRPSCVLADASRLVSIEFSPSPTECY
jgi:hypothetical protein